LTNKYFNFNMLSKKMQINQNLFFHIDNALVFETLKAYMQL
jgi:hypothetical protein